MKTYDCDVQIVTRDIISNITIPFLNSRVLPPKAAPLLPNGTTGTSLSAECPDQFQCLTVITTSDFFQGVE